MNLRRLLCAHALFFAASVTDAMHSVAMDGAEVVSFYGYDDCIRLKNDDVSVTLCPAAGGRVLEYSLAGENVLYLPAGDEGWRDTGDGKRGAMNAGRFDIGPEKVVRRGKVLWQGKWTAEITGDRSARMTSQFDPESGVRLVRDFHLHRSSSRLRCTQTIVNESKRPVSLCHWSRTFAVGGGVAVVPRSPRGRFPNGYTMYPNGNEILIRPEDPNVQVSDRAVIVSAAPQFPKLGFDSHSGWLAYLAPTDQLFVKRFKTYPGRSYNEFAGLTISVWYPRGYQVELEPIGPAEDLQPGEKASFSEEWWLLPHPFPKDVRRVEFDSIEDKVKRDTVPALAQPEPPVSPEIHADRKVTFRFVGEEAKDVSVELNGQSINMLLGEEGLWQVTTDPLSPGIHDYTLRVDGVRVTDPRNRWVKKWKVCASMLEIPGDQPLLTEQQDVPHGALHHHFYRSETVAADRPVIVYTPPGYASDAREPYPLLVLCHGNGDDQTAWTEVGRAHMILDNLIASGKIEPMVVAMPHGHPVPLREHEWSEDYSARNQSRMVDDVIRDLLPMMEARYHVAEDPARRAITGLSMGGGQSIAVAMKHPASFQWVGAFSAAAPRGDLENDHLDFVMEGDAVSLRQLFWIACGEDDFLIQRNRDFIAQLQDRQIEHRYVETEGSHNWDVWRDYLPTFLQLLFRE